MILLTGGTGLVGSHIAYELAKQGKQLRALKRKQSTTAAIEKIFRHYAGNDAEKLLGRVEWVEGDLLDVGSLEDALEGVTHVFHAAAMVSFLPADRKKIVSFNIDGTANLVNLSLDAGVKKFCHVSSIAALGKSVNGKIVTEDTWWKTDSSNSWYAISKYGAEREVWRGTQEGLDAVIVSPSMILGPGDGERSSTQLFSALRKGLKWYTDGVNGYVDVRDVAAAAVKLMFSEIKNERFILSAENLSYRAFVDKVLKNFNLPVTKFRAGKFLTGIGWRAEKFLSVFSGKQPRLTPETTAASHEKNYYDGNLITRRTDFTYRNMDETIREVCGYYCET
ncbi:MAG TPA: NAD-dependent epimerase/dehydratase family protein [Bacteroidia bacterium]|nr:NAD-dependent epimerase/dehydratase family protein [Bacteroidia bacterium]